MPLGRRRPLLRGAMVGGAAYHAGKVHANRNAAEAEQNARLDSMEQQQYAPPPQEYAAPAPVAAPAAPAALSMDAKAEQLTKLKSLLDQGILTEDEFNAQKQQILAS